MKKITFGLLLLGAVSINAQIFSDDFEGETVDATVFANWESVDQDGDGETFEVADITGSPVEASPLQGLVADSDSWEGSTGPLSPDNFLITLNTIDLTGVSDGTLDFTLGTYQNNGSFIQDRLAVYVSTSNDPAIIAGETPILDTTIADQTPADNGGENSAVNISLDLSAFADQEVYIVFRHFESFDENSVLIDNVAVNGSLSTLENVFDAFSHYQVDNILSLRSSNNMNNVELFNLLGQQVMSEKLEARTNDIDLSSITPGIYVVRVTIGEQQRSFKIVNK